MTEQNPELADLVKEADEFVTSLVQTVEQGQELVDAAKAANDADAIQSALDDLANTLRARLDQRRGQDPEPPADETPAEETP